LAHRNRGASAVTLPGACMVFGKAMVYYSRKSMDS